MAWTWEEILTDSLSLSGILGQGQIADPAMLSDAKRRASRLLDKLDGKGIALPVFSIDVYFNTVSDQERYVLGTGADLSPASAIRPETIINGQLQIQGGSQPTYLPLRKMEFPDYRDRILVPRNLSQPIYYSLNPSWPQADLYLWPVPNQVWQVRLTCKVKWIDVVTNPETNVFSYAELPSGYTDAFTNVLAFELAKWRQVTPKIDLLKADADDGLYTMTAQTWTAAAIPAKNGDSFPWDVTRAGMNP